MVSRPALRTLSVSARRTWALEVCFASSSRRTNFLGLSLSRGAGDCFHHLCWNFCWMK